MQLQEHSSQKKFYPKKKRLWSETEVYTDYSSIKEDSTIIQIHPATINLPLEGKTKDICNCSHKPAYVHGYISKNCLYT